MATPVLFQTAHRRESTKERQRERPLYAAGLITGLTGLALVVHGFHPYAEDGGLYIAGVKRVLDPTLYASGPEFVLGHLRFSLFAPSVAWLVRASGMQLETVLLTLHLASIWAALGAAWLLAGRCFNSLRERTGAVTLLAVWLTLPIAGTSLMLMDPYVTARSFSTPLTLFALVGALDFLGSTRGGSRWKWGSFALSMAALAGAALAHPLMAAYGLACVLALAVSIPERLGTRIGVAAGLAVAALVTAAILQTGATPEHAAYRAVAMSRYYWFLSEWHWYELAGAIAPLAILGAVAWSARRETARRELALMGLTAGSTALLVAAVFAREGSATHLVARLQPMRVFQLIYIVMILFVGAALARYLGMRKLRWAAALVPLCAVMFLAERETFPASAHIELTETAGTRTNGWVQAFEWIRENTPKDAMFALDADYITRPGEDAQCFRAIAERSALPDYSKDGGEAAITPALTEEWKQGQEAQTGLSRKSDADRFAALAPKGVEWLVLEKSAITAFTCDYTNATVKVCRLPNSDSADGVRLSLKKQPPSPQQQALP
ncbi:MAG: hypothetical protein JST61_16935 [Acidobacteria bacterium]|nr:hypothetical protein [Acidobacteriota bacterium]